MGSGEGRAGWRVKTGEGKVDNEDWRVKGGARGLESEGWRVKTGE